MRNLLMVVLLVFACAAAYAQTPDDETPANEGICDGLIGFTPGLYGLCVAFCEAQDCEPDFSLEDPFENCNPSSEKLLEIYRRRKQDSDPGMPCIKSPCPCWTPEELATLVLPEPITSESCRRPPPLIDGDYWMQARQHTSGTYDDQFALMFARDAGQSGDRWWPGSCGFTDKDYPPKNHTRWLGNLTPEEVALCRADVIAVGIERGFTCWD